MMKGIICVLPVFFLISDAQYFPSNPHIPRSIANRPKGPQYNQQLPGSSPYTLPNYPNLSIRGRFPSQPPMRPGGGVPIHEPGVPYQGNPHNTWHGAINAPNPENGYKPPIIKPREESPHPLDENKGGPPHPPGAVFMPPPIPTNNVDYCALPCGTMHIACPQNGLVPHGSCPLNPHYYSLDDLKDFIVDLHNKVRNDVAAGHVNHLPPASRMGTMQWDHDLHVTATYRALLCLKDHTTCHITPTFKEPGENIGGMRYGGYMLKESVQSLIQDSIESWASGSQNCTRDIITSLPNFHEDPSLTQTVKDVATFTVMVREGNTRVGCGINWFESDHNIFNAFTVCHYATNNYITVATYKEGPTASECKTGTNPKYPSLCSVDEKYHLHETSIINQ